MKTSFRFCLALGILIWFFPPCSAAQAGNPLGWQDLGLYGGQINAIAFCPLDPNTLFAGTYYGDGLFKSTDGGDTWRSVDGFRNELIYSIVFSPRDPSTIWVVTPYSIYKSPDKGQTWASYDPCPLRYYYTIAVDPQNADVVYVGTGGPVGLNSLGRVYKTTDGGLTWRKCPLVADHNVWSFSIDPQNTRTIWAVTGPEWIRKGSIYRSQDGGASWSRIRTGLRRGWYYFVVVHPLDSNIVYVGGENGLYRTHDAGMTWSQLEPKNWCRAFALSPDNPNKLYAAWYDSNRDESVLSISADGAESWVTRDAYPFEFLSLAAHPERDDILYGGDAGLGIYVSSDDGESWSPGNEGIKANNVYDSAVDSNGNLLVASQGGLFLQNGAGFWEGLVPFPCRSVAVNQESENIVFAGFDWGFGKSADGGENWSFGFIPSPEPHRFSSLSIDDHNPGILYLGVFFYSGRKGEIYKSTDSGQSVILKKTFSAPVNVVKVHPDDSLVLYAGNGMFYGSEMPGGVFISTDSGETWEEKGLTDKVVNTLAIDPDEPNTIYSGCGSARGFYAGLFKSNDSGQTWERKDYGIPEGAAIVDISLDPANNNILYAATHRHGVFISHDGGNYWTLIGLSEYWIYDILSLGLPPLASGKTMVSRSALSPPSSLFSGSGSGFFAYSGSGMGVIRGIVTDIHSGLKITGATISTDTGGIALSLEGAYIMFSPAGICTVRASMNGYEPSSEPGIMISSGSAITVDLTLTPLLPISPGSIDTHLAAAPTDGGTMETALTPRARSRGLSELEAWNPNSNVTLTPSSNGDHTVVVPVSNNSAIAENMLADAGLPCTIGE